MAMPMAFPATAIRPLPGAGTTLVSAQQPVSAPAVMTTESFDAPEGMYVCTSRFTSPPQPMIHLNPVPTTQVGLSAIYPTPRVSTVSPRIPVPSKKASDSNDTATAPAHGVLLEAPLASQGIDAPSTSLTGGLPPGSAGPSAGIAGIGGPGMGFSGLGETMGKLSAKPTRPKNSLKNTSSSFVNRMMTHPDLAKILSARTENENFTFLTNARSLFWLADTTGRTKESLGRITFGASPSVHDVNQFTRAHDRLDLIIGFVTGDLIWLDPIAAKYTRVNKGGCIANSAVTQVRWLPGSENLIMAAHADGSIVVYDREREDPSDFSPATWEALAGSTASSSSAALQSALAAAVAAANASGLSGKGKETAWSRLNPVSHWAVSKTRITDFAFSPDYSHVAITAEDGILRIADVNSERLLDTFESYFGGLNCIAWSPDGKFLLTGGEDDLVTVWAPREGRIVARCQGHTSFVTGLAWDPWRWSSEDRTYRFASVGEDCKMILWDFSSAALNRPKTYAPHANGPRRSSVGLGSTYSLGADKHGVSSIRSPASARRVSTNLGSYDRDGLTDDTIRHPALPRSEVAILQPVVTVEVDGEIPTSLRFSPDKVVVVRKNAAVDTFTRPLPKRPTSVVASVGAGERTSGVAGARSRMGLLGRGGRMLEPLKIGEPGARVPSSVTTPTTPRNATAANGNGITA
uniref:Uncharacterized protein n=1 Tax=Kalmanozyma brasiliensis (strain GHG001) TaxID=1365824 RepID=V5E4M9_KALBG